MFSILIIVARLLLGGAFVVFAVRNYLKNVPRLTGILEARNIQRARAIVLAGIALQLVGGLLVAIGPFGALGGVLMIIFLITATVLFHPAWEYKGDEQAPHLVAVIMNTSLVGAFLMIVAHGL